MRKAIALACLLLAGASWSATPAGGGAVAPSPLPVPEKVNCPDVLASDDLVPLKPKGWSVRAGQEHLFYLVSYDQYLAVLKACLPR